MLGDINDIRGRIRAVLPLRWFSDQSPNLDALLSCIATPWAWIHGLIQYSIQQARLATASDQWLDLISFDFLGASLPRRLDENDAAYRIRIQFALVQGAATRTAVGANLANLTGFAPVIFEPTNCGDTGGYGSSNTRQTAVCFHFAYGMAGGWGCLTLPFQVFITTRRPEIKGVASLGGYCTGSGGYGKGLMAYINLGMLPGNVTDADIERCVSSSLPIATVAWLRII